MAAIFERSNPASPLHYSASQTALVLLDFQGWIIDNLPDSKSALANAKLLRDWALRHGLMVLHSVVDVNGIPPPTTKSAERVANLLASLKDDKAASEEPSDIAFSQQPNEYIVLKSPGVVSGLKTGGAAELLAQHGTKSLVLCGLSTSGAVLRTAVQACDDGFVVSVVSDGCADRKVEVHEMLLESVLPNRAHICTAEEFMNAWDG
jgi:nicotinamidase-related amidase